MKVVGSPEAPENGASRGDAGEPGRFLFDVTGVVHWYAYFKHPSGIQRVTEKLLSSSVLRENGQVEFVARMLGGDTFYRIDASLLADLDRPERRSTAIARFRAIFTQSMRLAGLRRLLPDTRYYHIPYILLGMLRLDRLVEWYFAGRRRPRPLPALEAVHPPGPNDVLFNPGDLWWQKQYVSVLIDLKRRTGVTILQMIHDLFVIERPEWFQPGFARLFTGEFETLAPHVDRWITNSNFVTEQLVRYLRGKSLPIHPIAPLPMGWDSFRHLANLPAAQTQGVLKRYGVDAMRPYILFVGTVEPRKNLPMLLDALDDLRAELGSRVPDLIVVGGWGWRSSAVRSRLRKNPHVHWFRGVPDADLVAFYREARFTVAPSFTEGWGLPVQESIAHGVPCITSSGGAMLEAGAGLVASFDPSRPEELRQAMKRWIVDEETLLAERARIARGLPMASATMWNDGARMLLKHAFG